MNKMLLQILFQSIKYFATSIALRVGFNSGIPNFFVELCFEGKEERFIQ